MLWSPRACSVVSDFTNFKISAIASSAHAGSFLNFKHTVLHGFMGSHLSVHGVNNELHVNCLTRAIHLSKFSETASPYLLCARVAATVNVFSRPIIHRFASMGVLPLTLTVPMKVSSKQPYCATPLIPTHWSPFPGRTPIDWTERRPTTRVATTDCTFPIGSLFFRASSRYI